MDENERKIFLREIIYDYDFALLKFLYMEDRLLKLNDFPDEFKKLAPQVGNSINDGNLIQSLFRLRPFIDNENSGQYQINDIGRIHYENSVEQKYKEEEFKNSMSSGAHINVLGDNAFIANQSSFLDKVIAKPIKEINTNTNPKIHKNKSWLEIAAWIAGIIGTIILLYQFIGGHLGLLWRHF